MNVTPEQITDTLCRDVRHWIATAETDDSAPLVLSDFEDAQRGLSGDERHTAVMVWWKLYRALGDPLTEFIYGDTTPENENDEQRLDLLSAMYG